MRGIRKALAVTGLDGKTFGKDIGIDKYMMSKFINGHCNPTPDVFRKICDRSGLAPKDVATVEEVDYGVIPLAATPHKKGEDKRKKRASLRFRILQKQRKQIDKDLKTMGFATVQSWGDFCIKELNARAQQIRREREQ